MWPSFLVPLMRWDLDIVRHIEHFSHSLVFSSTTFFSHGVHLTAESPKATLLKHLREMSILNSCTCGTCAFGDYDFEYDDHSPGPPSALLGFMGMLFGEGGHDPYDDYPFDNYDGYDDYY